MQRTSCVQMLIACAVLISILRSAVADDIDPKTKAIAAQMGIELKNETVEASEIKEGWNKTYDWPSLPLGGGPSKAEKIHLWVEQGWINASATNEHGRTDWQVALAQPDGKSPLEVNFDMGFTLNYGRYFVRDKFGKLRLLREFKDANSPAWPEMKYDGDKKKVRWSGRLVRLMPKPTQVESNQFIVGDWHWVQSGALKDKPDVWLRVEHKDLVKGGIKAVPGVTILIGERAMYDEGDLFLGDYDSVSMAEFQIDINKAQAALKTNPAPELDCKDWHHTDNDVAVSMQALRGSVVLLDFWGGGYHIQNEQEKLQALYQKYKDRGLMVVAVHSDGMGKEFEDLLKEHKFYFPVGIDKGDSAKHYGVDGYPTWFLIDRQGMVKQTSHGLPSDNDIEKLLDAQ